jgi:hypothetical protein
MSRTFFSLRRRRGFGARHPAPLSIEDARVVSCPGLFHLSSCIFVSSDDADQFRNGIKPCGCTVSTMGLSEARGLVLFRVIRGGIGVTRRLGATGTISTTGHSHTHPRTRASPEPTGHHRKDHRRWKGSSPETLKRLAILVFRRRSFLPSSTESA